MIGLGSDKNTLYKSAYYVSANYTDHLEYFENDRCTDLMDCYENDYQLWKTPECSALMISY